MIAWNFQRIVGTCQFRVPWFGYPCGYSSLTSFRHRYAKNFLEKYNDIALLADLMGHESIETTRIYLRRTASEQQELVDKIVTW